MKLYLLYLSAQLGLPILFATTALTGAVWLSQSLRFVDLVVNQGVPIGSFLRMTVLLLPSLLLVILPLALFCAVLFVYHRLTQESELTVLRAAGLSDWQLAAPCLLLGTVVTGLGFAISLYFMPLAYRDFRDLQLELRRDFPYPSLQPGVFNTPTAGVTIFVRGQADDGALLGILVHDGRDVEAPVTMTAEKGLLLSGERGPVFVLERGSRQETDGHGVALLHFDRHILELAAGPEQAGERARKLKELYLSELWYPSDPDLSETSRRAMTAEGHKRLIWPLHAPVFGLIALAGLLGRRPDGRPPARSMVVAVLGALAVQAASMAAASLAARSLAMLPLLYGVVLLPGAACLLLLAKRPRRPPVRMTLAARAA